MRFSMNDMNNWSEMTGAIILSGIGQRTVELHVNLTEPTVFRMVHEVKQEGVKLVGWFPPGKHEMRINAWGEVQLVAETETVEGEVWYYDPSGRNERRKASEDHKSFTGPLNRVQRNPELERLAMLMENRAIQRQRVRDEQHARQMAEVMAEQKKGSAVNQDTGEVKDDDGTSANASGQGEGASNEAADSGEASGTQPARGTGAGEGQSTDTATSSKTKEEAT